MSLAKYAFVVLGILVGSSSVLGLTLGNRLQGLVPAALFFGAALAAANTLLAHAMLRWSQGRSMRAFLIVVLGGMAGRMAAMLGLLLIAMMALRLPTLPLVASLMGHFAMFQALELFTLRNATTVAASR